MNPITTSPSPSVENSNTALTEALNCSCHQLQESILERLPGDAPFQVVVEDDLCRSRARIITFGLARSIQVVSCGSSFCEGIVQESSSAYPIPESSLKEQLLDLLQAENREMALISLAYKENRRLTLLLYREGQAELRVEQGWEPFAASLGQGIRGVAGMRGWGILAQVQGIASIASRCLGMVRSCGDNYLSADRRMTKRPRIDTPETVEVICTSSPVMVEDYFAVRDDQTRGK